MATSVHSNPLFGLASAEHRLQAALGDVSALQNELDRTYQVLERIEGDGEQAHEAGCCQTQLDDVRFQLSELVAIGAERRALQHDTTILVAQAGELQEQHLELQQRIREMKRQWFAGDTTAGAAVAQEVFVELQQRMASLKQQWVAREITSAAARQASQDGQPNPAELASPLILEAVACPA